MKKMIFLIVSLVLIKTVNAGLDHSSAVIENSLETVDVSKIYQLKDSLEADSNLVFTISRFTYFGLTDLELNSIIKDINNGIWPTYKKLGITFSETHYAYDESESHNYVGEQHLAVNIKGYETTFVVFWVNPDKSRGKDE